MSIDLSQLALFVVALGIMVATPGPLVAAIMARAASGGFRAAAPLAYGAAVSEAIYIGLALVGLAALAASYAWVLEVLRWGGAAWLVWIGIGLIRNAGAGAGEPLEIAPGAGWRTFLTGLFINLGNPKVALFYMAIFPGFFDIAAFGWLDTVVVLVVASSVGLLSDLTYTALADRAGAKLRDKALRTGMDRATGGVMIGAGAVIAGS